MHLNVFSFAAYTLTGVVNTASSTTGQMYIEPNGVCLTTSC